jgi:hypothetical protein
MRPYVSSAVKVHTHNRKRVAVLISGNGSNLQVCLLISDTTACHKELSELNMTHFFLVREFVENLFGRVLGFVITLYGIIKYIK